jgi:hypothetical protein
MAYGIASYLVSIDAEHELDTEVDAAKALGREMFSLITEVNVLDVRILGNKPDKAGRLRGFLSFDESCTYLVGSGDASDAPPHRETCLYHGGVTHWD